jgi:hypothetical protein
MRRERYDAFMHFVRKNLAQLHCHHSCRDHRFRFRGVKNSAAEGCRCIDEEPPALKKNTGGRRCGGMLVNVKK